MPICHRDKFIFFHIPRCAGTSITARFQLAKRQALHGVQRQNGEVVTLHHLTPGELSARGLVDAATLQSYFKFTIIRDPLGRILSDYIWQRQHDPHHQFRGLSFARFLDKAEDIVANERYFERVHFDHFRPMVEYCIQDGELAVDDILLLENLDNELRRIEERIGPVQVPRLNSSQSPERLYSSRDRDRVYRLYEADKILHENISRLSSEKVPLES